MMKSMRAWYLVRSGLLIGLLCVWGITPKASAAELLPGDVWHDSDGKAINAHGGGVLFHQGTYYWYGEHKSGKTILPECNKHWGGTRVDVTGVSCYSSANLTEWKNEGIVLRAVKDDAQSDLHPSKVLERPKVIYNKKTKTFVMWMHIDSANYAAARSGVAVSAQPAGPFKYLGSFRPNAGIWPQGVTVADKIPSDSNPLARDFRQGQMARDMALFVDDDGKAYQFYSSEENATMHVSLLADDYLRPAGKYHRIFVGRSMEAPAVFKRSGKYYLIASGCTAWNPNAARLAVAENIFGPWTELENPCIGTDADKTFQSQGAFVLPVQGRSETYIFMADRWKQWDLADSRYVWLPVEFRGEGKPVLRWRERWSLNTASTREQAAISDANSVSRFPGKAARVRLDQHNPPDTASRND
jgi:hypothetical protein